MRLEFDSRCSKRFIRDLRFERGVHPGPDWIATFVPKKHTEPDNPSVHFKHAKKHRSLPNVAVAPSVQGGIMSKSAGLTRRGFLELIGRIGGSTALYQSMTALGFASSSQDWAGPLPLEPDSGRGKTVAILGAGIAGLTSAYELSKAGYEVIVLEATDRAGGRNLTARKGSVINEVSPSGRRMQQVAQLDEGLYLNLGPGRLPFHHRRALHYCNELGVKLEIYVMSATANLYQTDKAFGGKAMPRYRIANDVQAHVSELLSKAVNKKALDDELTPDERGKLVELLNTFGGLPGGLTAGGETPRTGCVSPSTIEDICAANPELPLRELLNAEFWQHIFYQSLESEWQPTLFQPVGGMDKLVDGFKRQVGQYIRYRCEVTEITARADTTDITYQDRRSGKVQQLSVDYCISSIPVVHLRKIKNNFSSEYRAALEQYRDENLFKLGWQANQRFWESDKYKIYGGISYTDDPITQMWYPSYDYFSSKGTLTGIYTYNATARAFGSMTHAERVVAARKGAIKLHEEFASEFIVPSDRAISIFWADVPFQSGGGAAWQSDNPADQSAYKRLLSPEQRFFLTGDQISPLPGWQEGAMMSAEHVLAQIAGQVPANLETMQRMPDAQTIVTSV
jgi:monoamine oxidase